eukprot:TRINITY_DN16988_c0_g1_i1.p1 TRINITY_DN16988_c0_g1~~TRINITY_DN16988_c0_g1_i1.p1  ORF type:complete len:215 (-),score=30.66 TRINITY_DN16988_c0_g1_i1:151-795(-)
MDSVMDDTASFQSSFGLDGASGASRNTSLSTLKRIWLNEKYAPELLPFASDVVPYFHDKVQEQEDQLAGLNPEDESDRICSAFIQMEINRVRYLLRAYLRARLSKIEQFHSFLLNGDQDRLSEEEANFLEGYSTLVGSHLGTSVLDKLPEKHRSVDDVATRGPDMNKHMICRIRKNFEGFVVKGEAIDLVRNQLFVIRYSLIRDLLEDGVVELI